MEWKKLSEENPIATTGTTVAFWDFASDALVPACCILGVWMYYDYFEGWHIHIQPGQTSESVDFGDDPLWVRINNPKTQE